MIETIKKEWQAKVVVFLLVFFTGWWFILQIPEWKTELLDKLFGGLYGTVAVWGAVWGIVIAERWGGLKSVMGKAILLFSLGLFFQEFGQLAYFYYVFFLGIDVPYPSIGDIGYFGSIPLYIVATIYLAKASGVSVSLQAFHKKIQAILLPAGALILAYYLFLQTYEFDWSKPLNIFLDFGYPMGQAIYLSLALLTYFLTRGMLGGVMKTKVLFILIALLVQFFADYTFLYQTLNETWVAGGINDYMYLVAYFLMALGLLQLKTVFETIRHT